MEVDNRVLSVLLNKYIPEAKVEIVIPHDRFGTCIRILYKDGTYTETVIDSLTEETMKEIGKENKQYERSEIRNGIREASW